MSFLANKNLSGVGASGRSFSTANNIRSMPILASGGATNSLVAAAMAALGGSSATGGPDGDVNGVASPKPAGSGTGSGSRPHGGTTASTTEMAVGGAAKARAALEARAQAAVGARANSCGAPVAAVTADVAAAVAAAGSASVPAPPPRGPLAALAAASGLPYANDPRSTSSATPHFSRLSSATAAAVGAAMSSISATLQPSPAQPLRRPPTRRIIRPAAVADVAEEAGTPEASGKLPTVKDGSGGSVNDSTAVAATLASLAVPHSSVPQAQQGSGPRSQVPSLAAVQAAGLSEVEPAGVVDSDADADEEDDECWHGGYRAPFSCLYGGWGHGASRACPAARGCGTLTT